jgi:hypothetical protein
MTLGNMRELRLNDACQHTASIALWGYPAEN